MKPRFNNNWHFPFAFIFVMGAVSADRATAQTFLIDAATNNGSFELLGPAPGAVNPAKATDWDLDADGDVTYWTQFPGNTVRGDSGTEVSTAATEGTKQAFFQGGNAAYNMTTHVIQAGDTFTVVWDAINAIPHTATLVYDNNGTLVSLGPPVTNAAAGNNVTLAYTVAPGEQAVGKTIGIKFGCTVGYPQIDNVRLSFVYTAPVDSDNDGLPDSYEMEKFGNLTQSGASDTDGDGLTNLQELNKTYTQPNLADTDGDTLLDGAEFSGSANAYDSTPTNPLSKDSDNDGINDFEENGSLNASFSNAPTNPHSADSDEDNQSDYVELAYHSDPNDSFSFPEPVLHDLISNTLLNGSFELRNGVLNTDKTRMWDAAPAGDVDNWTEWTGVSTVADDTGVEGGGSNGAMRGYFRSGNAAYNLTSSVAAAGNVYACTWKHLSGGGGALSVRLVYSDGGTIVPLPDSLATTTAVGGVGNLIYRIPAGSPAIGKPIGIGVSSVGTWIGIDEVNLTIADADSDMDGLGDFFEDEFFGNNDGNPTPAELALQSGEDDYDDDGLSNADEILVGTIATNPDFDGDTLKDGDEFFGNSNAYGSGSTDPFSVDSDGDGVSDADENGALNIAYSNEPTDPNSPDTDSDGVGDKRELVFGSDPNSADSVPTPVFYDLINNNKGNGSFEYQSGVATTVKSQQWDAPAPHDIDNWMEWTGVSAEPDNSGAEPGGSEGFMLGFFQAGNAAYNLTSHIAAAGDLFSCTWNHLNNAGLIRVRLVYDDGGVIKPIEESLASTTTADQVGDLAYRIPAGSPAIGKAIGIGVAASVAFMHADEFRLSTAASDSDGDKLADQWETDYFGNLSQTATGDPDNDGFTNLQEQAAGTDPTSAALPGDTDADGLADALETQYFGNLDQTANGDFDSDGTANLTEFRLNLDPTTGASRFAATVSGPASITWPSVEGVTFRIERTTSLSAGSWTPLGVALPGTAGTATYTVPAPPAGKSFYRVGLNP